MKTISAGLAQHLAAEVTTLATCWRITRRDGVVLGFTDHIRDLEVDGVTYEAASGYTRTAIRSTADLAVDNLDLESVFADDGITEENLHTGGYGNYESLVQGILSCGTAGFGDMSASKARRYGEQDNCRGFQPGRYSSIEEPSQRNDLTPLISLVTLFAARAQ